MGHHKRVGCLNRESEYDTNCWQRLAIIDLRHFPASITHTRVIKLRAIGFVFNPGNNNCDAFSTHLILNVGVMQEININIYSSQADK